ncbi:Hypothetical predicted protein [Octopus vulgaris]|uniref:Uncharacterized protein n=2 Tax=Octopus TaxID=6643 RepID=A0AA36AT33_OCTVU|nr:uncharacterized protein LOC118763071 [Octopus sinensis]CAI9721061.1 Hypothetical predicted protein [Octopus vulgaris]
MSNDSKVTAQGLKVTHEPTEEVRSNRNMSLLWVPYVVLAAIMVLFFSVSFAHYHLKRRKYQLRRWASKCLREEMKNSSGEVFDQPNVPQVGEGLAKYNDSLRQIDDIKTLPGAVAKIDFKNDFTIDIKI